MKNRLIAVAASILAAGMLVAQAAPATKHAAKTPTAHVMTVKGSQKTMARNVRRTSSRRVVKGRVVKGRVVKSAAKTMKTSQRHTMKKR